MNGKDWNFETLLAAELIEFVAAALEGGKAPVLRARYKTGEPVNIGFHLVPDYTGVCAACKGKLN